MCSNLVRRLGRKEQDMKIGDEVHFVLLTDNKLVGTHLRLDQGRVVSFDQETVCVLGSQRMYFVAPYQLFGTRDEAGNYLANYWQNMVTSPDLAKRFVSV